MSISTPVEEPAELDFPSVLNISRSSHDMPNASQRDHLPIADHRVLNRILLVTTPVLHGIPWLVQDAWWCGWLAIAAGLILVTSRGWTSSWWATWLWGAAAIGIAFHWSPDAMAYTLSSGYGLGLLVALPLILWDGLRLGMGYWLAARITKDPRNIWFPAAIFTMLIEFCVPSVFPWRLGFMQLAAPLWIQPVEWFGAGWTTFVALATAGMLIHLLVAAAGASNSTPHSKSSKLANEPGQSMVTISFAACMAVIVFNGLFGLWAVSKWNQASLDAQKVRFGLIQVDPSDTESTSRARKLTESIANQVDIVCWPESSGGNYELGLDDLKDRSQVFAQSREPERGLQPWPNPSCELLLAGKNFVGDHDSPERIHVTAMLIDPKEQISARYHKRYLMPFGEYVPAEESIPGLAELFDMSEHVQPGTQAQIIPSTTGARIGTMLCYEDMIPEASWSMTRQECNVLVSLINGSAFASRFTLEQHRLLAQLRAVECRKTMLRCAATGETCVITPTGVITNRLPVQTEGALLAEVPLLSGGTLYTRFPWLTPLFCSVACIGLVVSKFRSRTRPHLGVVA